MKLTRLLRPLINYQHHLCQRFSHHDSASGSINDTRKNSTLVNTDDDSFFSEFEESPVVQVIPKERTVVPQYIEKIGTVSRRFKWEDPGENRALIATYLRGSYTGWHVHYLQQYPDLNRYQRKVMFEKECENFIFSENPANFSPKELGLSDEIRIPKRQLKIKLTRPNEVVYHHDLCEMWKRRQQIDIPFINVGSYVEIKYKSGYAAQPSLTFSGLCIMKKHSDLHAYVTLRRSYESQEDDAVEKTFYLYSPWIESVKIISYQVRSRHDLKCIRDFDIKQSKLPTDFPKRTTLDNGVEVPHYHEQVVSWRMFKGGRSRGQRKHWAKDYLPPGRAHTLRLHKMWLPEHDPERTYKPFYKHKSYKKTYMKPLIKNKK